MISLHPYQSSDIESIRQWFRKGCKTVLWYMPTGAGKSFASAFMFITAAGHGKTCWFIVHRRELLRQTEKQFQAMGIDYGVIASGRGMQPWKLVQICSIGTLLRRMHKLRKPHFAAFDECHHLRANTWTDIYKYIEGAYIVGLSASPCRADGGGLAQYFGALVATTQIRQLIAAGYLSPFRTFAPPTVETSGLHVRAGDYIITESEALMDKPTITGSAVSEYRRLCDGKRAIVFCCSVEHSKHVAAQFRESGYAALHMDGTIADTIRDMAIDDFEKGKIQVLCNVDLCGEGLSINAIECVILLRPTQSLGLFIQQVGRGLRRWSEKKELIILDHVGSTVKFGMIDEPREWTLAGDVEKRKKKSPPGVRICPKCFAASSPRAPKCTNKGPPECDHVFEVKSRAVGEQEGELVEVTQEELARRRERRALGYEQFNADTIEKLVEVLRKKGRKGDLAGQARHILAARAAKKLKERASG